MVIIPIKITPQLLKELVKIILKKKKKNKEERKVSIMMIVVVCIRGVIAVPLNQTLFA